MKRIQELAKTYNGVVSSMHFMLVGGGWQRSIADFIPGSSIPSAALKAAAMCMAPHAEIRPPPPIPPFLLAQNLSSKRMAPTDNMQPKFHDKYTCHLWLKGYTVAFAETTIEGARVVCPRLTSQPTHNSEGIHVSDLQRYN